jgi:hypothetical protein
MTARDYLVFALCYGIPLAFFVGLRAIFHALLAILEE